MGLVQVEGVVDPGEGLDALDPLGELDLRVEREAVGVDADDEDVSLFLRESQQAQVPRVEHVEDARHERDGGGAARARLREEGLDVGEGLHGFILMMARRTFPARMSAIASLTWSSAYRCVIIPFRSNRPCAASLR